MKAFDVIVIGAGHNGLGLALYTQKAGLRTLVLERRHEFGGGLSTEEVTIPGFYHNLHSNFHASIPFLPFYHDFDLAKRGVRYIHPEANLGMPLRDGRALVLYVNDVESARQIARFSERDAQAYLDLRLNIARHAPELMAVGYSPPEELAEEDREKLNAEVESWFGKGIAQMSALEFVTSRFENPHVQALLLFHMAVGGWDVRLKETAPLGLAFIGYVTNWQLCRGGSHQLAHAMGGEFVSLGGELLEHQEVAKILVEDGRAAGVKTRAGELYEASKAVVSAVDLHQTLLQMLPAHALEPHTAERVERLVYGHGDVLFGLHLALREAPAYPAASFNPDIGRTFNLNIGYERPEDLLEHYEEIDEGLLPNSPRLECAVNTLFDPTQAPPGFHTGLLWQFAPYEIEGMPSSCWDQVKHDYARKCIRAWSAYAPNVEAAVMEVYAYTPHDIAQKMTNMRRGGFHCLAVLPEQLAQKRPLPELSHYRGPVEGLYLCGSCMHAHGGIIGAPGYNCAQVLAKDLGVYDRLPFQNKFWAHAKEELKKRLGIGQ